jgi:hypothetical protein
MQMKIVGTKRMVQTWLSKYIEDGLETVFRKIFFWETDDKIIGKAIRFVHHSLVYITLIWYVIIHTFMPSYILFVFFYLFCAIIWLHQFICSGCAISRVECRLIGDTSGFVDPIMEAFHIPVTPESTDGVVVLGGTAVMFMLTFELLGRTINNIRSWISL